MELNAPEATPHGTWRQIVHRGQSTSGAPKGLLLVLAGHTKTEYNVWTQQQLYTILDTEPWQFACHSVGQMQSISSYFPHAKNLCMQLQMQLHQLETTGGVSDPNLGKTQMLVFASGYTLSAPNREMHHFKKLSPKPPSCRQNIFPLLQAGKSRMGWTILVDRSTAWHPKLTFYDFNHQHSNPYNLSTSTAARSLQIMQSLVSHEQGGRREMWRRYPREFDPTFTGQIAELQLPLCPSKCSYFDISLSFLPYCNDAGAHGPIL